MKKKAIILLIFFTGFWATPFFASLFLNKTLHAPLTTRLFWQEKVQVPNSSVIKFESFKYKLNSRGNPMRAYRGEPRRCVVIGGSTYFSKHVRWEDSFLYNLDERLREVYFEPYVYASLRDGQALTILNELEEKSEKYDCLVIGVQPTGSVDYSKSAAFPFWGQYTQYSSSPLYWVFRKSKDSLYESRHLGPFLKKILPKRDDSVSKRESKIWREENSEGLVYLPYEPSRKLIKQRKRRIEVLFKKAKKIAPEVYFITQPIAYSEYQHQIVEDVWWQKYERKLKNGKTVFLDNKAVAEEKRFYNKLSRKVAYNEGVKIIDLDNHLKDFLQHPRHVYYDKWHLTEYGTGLAAEYVSQFLGNN